MRLPELISVTNDNFSYAHVCDENTLTADGTNRVLLHKRLVDAVKMIISQTKPERRKKWYELSLVVLTENGDTSGDLAEDKWCEMIQLAHRYFRSGINNEEHVINHHV